MTAFFLFVNLFALALTLVGLVLAVKEERPAGILSFSVLVAVNLLAAFLNAVKYIQQS